MALMLACSHTGKVCPTAAAFSRGRVTLLGPTRLLSMQQALPVTGSLSCGLLHRNSRCCKGIIVLRQGSLVWLSLCSEYICLHGNQHKLCNCAAKPSEAPGTKSCFSAESVKKQDVWLVPSSEKPGHADQMYQTRPDEVKKKKKKKKRVASMQLASQAAQQRPVMSAGMAPEVDTCAGCAPLAGAYFFSQAQPEETPVPEGPSTLPPPPPASPAPAAMLVTVGMEPLVLVDDVSGSGDALVMPEDAVSMVDCCVLLLGSVSV